MHTKLCDSELQFKQTEYKVTVTNHYEQPKLFNLSALSSGVKQLRCEAVYSMVD